MKNIIYCCVFFALSTFAAQAQTDEASVLAAFKAGNDAMIAYNAEGMAAVFTEKAVLINPIGEMIIGRQAILPFYKGLFQSWGQPKGDKYILDKQVVRFLTPDIALLHTINTVLTKDQSGKELIQKFAQSMVFTRQNEKWLCESVQVTFVNPTGK
jgi:uncharacterized protein (TIGR02246 family)